MVTNASCSIWGFYLGDLLSQIRLQYLLRELGSEQRQQVEAWLVCM